MKFEHRFGTTAATLAAMVFALVLTSFAAMAESQFSGNWMTKDTKGDPFKISLSADGAATGDRAGEQMTGKWKEEGDTVVIYWDTEWTTKITKSGDKYMKTAIHEGKDLGQVEAQKAQ